MAHVAEWRVRQTTLTEGTNDLVLATVMRGSLPFQHTEVMAVGDTCDYVVHYDSVFEAGLGTMAADGKLARTTVYRAKHANGDINTTKVSLPAGVKTVIMTVRPVFDSGTRIVFQQTSVPIGWTKDTTSHNNKALRFTTGTVGSGGIIGFDTVFSIQNTENHTITIAEMPAHAHGGSTASGGSDHVHSVASNPQAGAPVAANIALVNAGTSTHSHGINSEGGGTGHNHPLDIRVQYADVTIGIKN